MKRELLAILLLVGCQTATRPLEPTAATVTPSAANPTAEALAATPSPPTKLSYVEDDFAGAMKEARAKGKLLFVDAWAPWCHTCIAMEPVLHDASLAPLNDTFVFASIDTDRDDNASFAAKYPQKVWPTFSIIDPESGTLLMAHGGSMQLTELTALLTTAKERRAATAGSDDAAFQAAHRAFAEARYPEAATQFEALVKNPGSRKNEALLGTVRSLYAARRDEACALFAEKNVDAVAGYSPAVDFLYYGQACATRLPTAAKRKASKPLEAAMRRRATIAPDADTTTLDSWADLMANLADLAEDKAAKRAIHTERLDRLVDAANRAGGPEKARAYDYTRTQSYLALQRYDEAIALFRQRIRDFPDSYEAWARLAWVEHEARKDVDAIVSVERALALSYGPRKLRYFHLKAEIQLGLGKPLDRVETLREAIRFHEGLAEGHRDEQKLRDQKKALAEAEK